VPTEAVTASFTSFGPMLRYLRRRARLTQRQLGFRVAYTEGHICRLERDQRLPDPATLAALFVPALRLEREPELAARLVALAAAAREGRGRPAPAEASAGPPDTVPEPPAFAVPRAALLAGLRERLAAEPGLALCGVAGAGKTTLAAAIAREEAAHRPVFWFGLVEGLPATLETLLHRLAAFLRDRGQPELSSAIDAGHVPLDRQLRLAAEALAARPALVCLDNAHLARDAGGFAALVRQVAELGAGRVLLTSREDLAWPPVATVRIDGLTPDESERLAARLAPELDADLCRRLAERTAGSPMLIRLAAGHLRGREHARDLLDSLATQPQVAGYLLETTVHRLSPGAQRLAALLAVLGQPADLHDERLVELALAAEGGYDWLAALQELQRRLLVDHPARAALHPLLRDHLYARLVSDLPRRRRLHRVAAAWLEEAGREPLAAAHHWMRGGSPGAATEVLCGHVDELVRRGEAGPAADLAAELERRSRADSVAWRLRVLRGDLLVNTARAAEAEAAYRQALALPAPAPVTARARWKLADCLLQRGGEREALALCRTAAAELAPEHVLLRAEVAAVASRAHLNRSEHDRALAAAREALHLAASFDPAAPDLAAGVEARAHNTLGVVLRLRREHEAALRHLQRSAAAAERARLSRLRQRSQFNAASLTIEEGDMEPALELYGRLLTEAEWSGDRYLAGRVLHALAYARHAQGRLDEALELNGRAIAAKAEVGDRAGGTNSRGQRAMLMATVGRVTEARELAAGCVAEAVDAGERWLLANHLDTLGVVELSAGDVPAALTALERALAEADAAGDRRLRRQVALDLALAHLAAGRPDAAAEVAGDRPEAGLGVQLDMAARFVDGALALARGDAAAALEASRATAAEARRTGHRLHEGSAAALAAAAGGGSARLLDVARAYWFPWERSHGSDRPIRVREWSP